MHWADLAESLALFKEGINNAARMEMMAITTRSSTSVKAMLSLIGRFHPPRRIKLHNKGGWMLHLSSFTFFGFDGVK